MPWCNQHSDWWGESGKIRFCTPSPAQHCPFCGPSTSTLTGGSRVQGWRAGTLEPDNLSQIPDLPAPPVHPWASRCVSLCFHFLPLCPCFVAQSFPHSATPLRHTRPPCASPAPGACSNSHPSSRWCHPAISSSVIPFSSCPQSLPASVFSNESDSQSTGALASASILPMNIQDWFPLGLTGLISLQSKGLSRVFSSTTVRKHRFFSAQPSLWFNFHVYTWLLEKPYLWHCYLVKIILVNVK